MNKIIFQAMCYAAFLIFSCLTGCKEESSSPISHVLPDTSGNVTVKKPNIYLYPTDLTVLSVQLNFPQGGKVIESIPAYLGGWNVTVEPNGRINSAVDYLFYECETPDAYQYFSGWIVQRDSLLNFFRENLARTGFREREITDFTEYWIPKLQEHPAYSVYPQYAGDIAPIVSLTVSKTPDSLLRLFYIIKAGRHSGAPLTAPVIPPFERKGFVVTEWGVVVK